MGLVFHGKIMGKTIGLCLMTAALGACSSGSLSALPTLADADDATSSSTKSTAKRATGQTVAQRLEAGQITHATSRGSTAVTIAGKGTTASASTPDKFQIRNNYVGGLDVSVEGDIVNLTQTEVKSDKNSWGKTAAGYSLALWNAGRGGRDGLFRNEDGQVFHKIIGYRHSDTKTRDLTLGHSVIGIQTPASAVAGLPRKIQYDGYFYANAMPGIKPAETDAIGTVGGLRIAADFDAETVVGTSRSFEVKGPTDLGSIPTADTLRFTGNISGTSYTGNIVSTQPQLNGAAINGQFYGAGAQETAGTISGQNATGFTQGFFTASDATQ